MCMVKLSYLWYANFYFEQINLMGNDVLKVFSTDTLMLESAKSIILMSFHQGKYLLEFNLSWLELHLILQQ